MTAFVTIVIPARDAQDSLPRTLAGLELQESSGGHEVIVVDNGSRDDTASLAEHSPVVTRVVRRERGDGPGAARNAGVTAATGPVLCFIDADCRPERGWLAAGADALGQADVVQGKILPDPAQRLGPFDRTLSVGHESGLYESANLFVRRELFERIGGFPPGLERGGASRGAAQAPFGEDVLFGWAARRAGARTAFCERALVYHEVTARSAVGYVAERERLSMFPELVAAVPELRDAFFYRRLFLSPRSARFDLAVAAALLALARRRPELLLAAAPYLSTVATEARVWGLRRGPSAALAGIAADAVGAVALARGSLRTGSPLL